VLLASKGASESYYTQATLQRVSRHVHLGAGKRGDWRLVGLVVRYTDRALAVLLTEQNTLGHLKAFKRKYEDKRV